MIDLFEQFATDENLEVSGTWVEYGEAKFLVARLGNRKYAKKLTAAVERNQKLLDRKDDAAEALSDKIMIDTLAETILLGWEGVKFKGVDLPYSVENAKMVLGLKDFRREIMKMAEDMEAYKVKQEEEAGKP